MSDLKDDDKTNAVVDSTKSTGNSGDSNVKEEDTTPANYMIGSFLPEVLHVIVNGSVEGLNYQVFTRLLAGSISLSKSEKQRILDTAETLSENQFQELTRIFKEERSKFANLSKKHVAYLTKLDKQHFNDWMSLEDTKVEISKKSDDEDKAAEIRRQLGL